jgi:hypothetical protein
MSLKAAMAVIAFHVNKSLTIYYFTNVSRQDFLFRVFRNAITPLVLALIAPRAYSDYSIIPICSVFYSLTWYFIINRIIVEN